MRSFFLVAALTLSSFTLMGQASAASFADCLQQATNDLLPGDCSPLHFLASGKTMSSFSPDHMGEPRDPIANLKNKDAHHETWEVVIPPMAVCPDNTKGSKTEVTINRDGSGNITSISSKKFPPPPRGSKALWGSPYTVTADYSYGSGSCQVDQITKKGLGTRDQTVTTFDRGLCQTVMGIVGKKKSADISESQRTNVLKAIDERNEELREDQEVPAPLAYDQNQGGIDMMVPVCKFNGVNPPGARADRRKLDSDMTTTGGSRD